jgi:hypothetical protein
MAERDKTATVNLKVRMKEPLRAQIEASATGRRISMNAEVIGRIENSFRDEASMKQALELAYGPRTTVLLLALGKLIRNAGTISVATKGKPAVDDAWLDDAFAYRQVTAGIEALMADSRLRPDGDAAAPTPHYLNVVGDPLPEWMATANPYDGIGAGSASALIEEILPKIRPARLTPR